VFGGDRLFWCATTFFTDPRVFDREFGREFGRAFGREFGREFGIEP